MDLAASTTLEARRPAGHRLGPYTTDGYWPLTLTHPSANEGFEDMESDSDDGDSDTTPLDADAADPPLAAAAAAAAAGGGGGGGGGNAAGSPRLLTKFAQPDSSKSGGSSATYRRDDRRVVGNEYDWGTYAHDRIIHGYGDDDDEEGGDDDEEYVSQMERFQALMQFLTQVTLRRIHVFIGCSYIVSRDTCAVCCCCILKCCIVSLY
jgi:hypothetical protein